VANEGVDFFAWLRRQFIIALAADDDLYEQLALKGGNAITLLHRIGNRTSLDIDYSLSSEVDPSDLERRAIRSLEERLREKGYTVFDAKFYERPKDPSDPRFSGYRLEFKLQATERWKALAGDLGQARRTALTVVPEDAQSGQTFVIEISRMEVVPEFVVLPIDEGFTCRVYTVELIAAEKLRAICQQMPEYRKRGHITRRPRDFYDLHALITEASINIASESFLNLAATVFAAKDVPLELLQRIPAAAVFHGEAWPAVVNMIPAGKPRDFSFYERFVISELRRVYQALRWSVPEQGLDP
jgi:predicted nucleotidyltransferase component of viral defense system